MERKIPKFKQFTPCDYCPLERPTREKGSLYRSDVEATVNDVRKKAGSSMKVLIRNVPPDFVEISIADHEIEEDQTDVWKCARNRSLGHCASLKVVQPSPEYL